MAVAANGVRVFDVGGQWVSYSQPQLIDLIDELGLRLVSQCRAGLKIVEVLPGQTYAYDSEHPTTKHIVVNMELYAFIAKLDDLCMSIPIDNPLKLCIANELDSMSMETLINDWLTTRAAKNIMKSIIRTTTGMDAKKISVLYYLAYSNSTLGVCNQYMCTDDGAREYSISGGAQQICFRLARWIGHENIVSNEKVVRVDQTGDEVTVTTSKQNKYTSSYAIVAIPPTEIDKIKFVPELPRAKKEALYEILIGNLVKFVVTYRKAFWKEKNYSGEMLSNDGPVLLLYDATTDGYPALTGYADVLNTVRRRRSFVSFVVLEILVTKTHVLAVQTVGRVRRTDRVSEIARAAPPVESVGRRRARADRLLRKDVEHKHRVSALRRETRLDDVVSRIVEAVQEDLLGWRRDGDTLERLHERRSASRM